MSIALGTGPSLIDRLRNLLPGKSKGIGVFYQGGKGAYIGTSWDFTRIANSVYGNPTGFRCVTAIESNFSRPPFVLLPEDSLWPHVFGKTLESSHPAAKLLMHPHPQMSATMVQRHMGRDLELTGKSFWFKQRDRDSAFGNPGPPTSLRRLPPQRVTVVGNNDDELLGFVYTDRAGRQVPILPQSLIYLRYPHPERTYDGIAPALIAGLPAETDTAGARFNRDLLANDSALPGYLVIDDLSPDDFKEWKQAWEEGAQPGKTRFIGGSAGKYFKVGQTNQELTYTELRQDSQDDIMRAFGTPRAVAFDVSHETYANAEREQALFMQQNILPKWVLIADEITLQLAPDFPGNSFKVAFDLTGIDELQDSRDAVVERGVKLMLVLAKTINEFRQEQGWPPVPWGDVPQAPLQQMSAIPLQPVDKEGKPIPKAPATPPPAAPTAPAPPAAPKVPAPKAEYGDPLVEDLVTASATEVGGNGHQGSG